MKTLTIKKLIILSCLTVLLGCSTQSEQHTQPEVIDVETNLNNYQDLQLTDIATQIQYIPLETSNKCLLEGRINVEIVDSFIVATNSSSCYLFNSITGNFIRKIGNKGHGPAEYKSANGFINPLRKRIFFLGWNKNLLEFDFEGNFIQSIPIPGFVDSFESPSIPSQFSYFSDQIVCSFINPIGTEEKLLLFFDNTGKVIKTFPNLNIFPENRFSFTTKESVLYHFDKNLFFKEIYNDTLFQVDNDALFPKYIFNTGKYKIPYESKWWSNEERRNKEMIHPSDILETKRYLFFTLYFEKKEMTGIYEKLNNQLSIVETNNGIQNNIDDFVPFSPQFVSEKGELVSVVDAYIIDQWFSNNPEKAKKLTAHLQKLKSLNENDNPVLMLVKLKE